MSREKISAIVVTVMLLGGIIGEGIASSTKDLLQWQWQNSSQLQLPPFDAEWSLFLQSAEGEPERTPSEREPLIPEVTMKFLNSIEDFLSRAQLLSDDDIPIPFSLELSKQYPTFVAVFAARYKFPTQIFSPDDSEEKRRHFSNLWQLIEMTVRNHYLATGKHLGIDELHGIVQRLLPEGIKTEINDSGMLVISDDKYTILVEGSKSYTLVLNNQLAEISTFAIKTVKYMPLAPDAFIIEEECGYYSSDIWFSFKVLKKVYPGPEGYIYEEEYRQENSSIGRFVIKNLKIDGERITVQIEYYPHY